MKFKINSINNIDCIDGMKNLQDNSFDLVIADPPYNLSKGYKLQWKNEIKNLGFGGEWNKRMEKWDNMKLVDYFEFNLIWINEMKRILKPTGGFWIFGTYHNIGIVNFILQLLNIEILNEVIWFKRNSFPNLRGRRFTASHESIIWGHVGKKREYYFNYDFTKNTKFPEDKIKFWGKQMRTVWDIPNNKNKSELKFGSHPTQKPLRLLERIILSTSKENWNILVPFAGAGSECVACLKHNRNFLGFELDKKFCEIALNRINDFKLNLFDK